MYLEKTTLEILRICVREEGLLCINNWKERGGRVCACVCLSKIEGELGVGVSGCVKNKLRQLNQLSAKLKRICI